MYIHSKSSQICHLLSIYYINLHLFINKLIFSIYLLYVLSWGAQPFVIQTCEVKSISGILSQNSNTHLFGHILGYLLPC